MDRPDLPGPLHRRGPRPLALHLMPTLPSMPLSGGSPSSSAGSPIGPDPALIAGIAAYRRHPYRRVLRDPPELWAEGPSRLLDYGGAGPAVVFVPSLVNRAYILDLTAERSMMRWLAARGVRPLLLDWGWPGPVERRFTLGDYVAGRLERALEAVGGPVLLVGYCMAGLLAVASALRRPDLVRGLAILATPWDFHAPAAAPALRLAGSLPWLDPALTATGTLPIDAMQTMFAFLEPGQVAAKYRSFATLPQNSPRARNFVALEDWLNDGVPLPAPVARECLGGWYGANAPACNEWRIMGLPIEPESLRMKVFVAVPDQDRIVPAASALPLAQTIPGAVLHQPRAGHIGMVAGSRAEAELWQPLLDWLKEV